MDREELLDLKVRDLPSVHVVTVFNDDIVFEHHVSVTYDGALEVLRQKLRDDLIDVDDDADLEQLRKLIHKEFVASILYEEVELE